MTSAVRPSGIPSLPAIGALAYSDKLLAIAPANLLAYWMLAEPSGSVATDSSGNARDGAYSNVTLGQTGVGDGRTAALFNGTSSVCNIYSAGLAGVFNGQEGTLALWFKGPGSWVNDFKQFTTLQVDGSNRIQCYRYIQTTNNIGFAYRAGAAQKDIAFLDVPISTYIHIALTWSKTANEFKGYMNGVQTGGTQTGLGTWVGSLGATATNLGAATNAPTLPCPGTLAHAALWSVPLSAGQIASLAVVS